MKIKLPTRSQRRRSERCAKNGRAAFFRGTLAENMRREDQQIAAAR